MQLLSLELISRSLKSRPVAGKLLVSVRPRYEPTTYEPAPKIPLPNAERRTLNAERSELLLNPQPLIPILFSCIPTALWRKKMNE